MYDVANADSFAVVAKLHQVGCFIYILFEFVILDCVADVVFVAVVSNAAVIEAY